VDWSAGTKLASAITPGSLTGVGTDVDLASEVRALQDVTKNADSNRIVAPMIILFFIFHLVSSKENPLNK
jgi:hypothetical protein